MVNSNRFIASDIITKALSLADLSNTDFLSYEDKVNWLNDSWKSVYQTIIQYNLDVFTVRAELVNAGGKYKLPFDCYQIKSVKNPLTGVEIVRRADSESALGATYEIRNNYLYLGQCAGPVEVVYWRKPYFLSIPNKTVQTLYDNSTDTILDICKDSILVLGDGKYYIKNLLTDSSIEFPLSIDNPYSALYLASSGVVGIRSGAYDILDFSANVVYSSIGNFSDVIKADDGMIYLSLVDGNNINFYIPGENSPVDTMINDGSIEDVVCIDNEFYDVPSGAFPIGIFDDRPAYTTNDRKLYLIDYDRNGSRIDIEEKVHVPAMGVVRPTKYGFLAFDGKLYSNIPDTELNFPNNIFYNVLATDLAVRFLAKQNADVSGVENMNKAAWKQLTDSIDQAADYPRVKLVRRR